MEMDLKFGGLINGRDFAKSGPSPIFFSELYVGRYNLYKSWVKMGPILC